MGGSKTNDCNFHCDGASSPPMELRLYQAFIFATPILFALVLLLLFYMLYLRRRRNAWNAHYFSSQVLPRGFVTVVAVPPPRGLDKTFRDSLPTVVFNERYAAGAEDRECAVCLGDYELDEILRELPICGHAFHLDCIDKWLSTNTTCPICRASLLQESRVVPIDVATQHGTHQQAVEVNGIQPQLPRT